jgi:hypothetical protein
MLCHRTRGTGDLAWVQLVEVDASQNRARFIACAGNRHGLASDLATGGIDGNLFLDDVFGLEPVAADLRPLLDGQWSPAVVALPENEVLNSVDGWRASGGCPDPRTMDLVRASAGGVALAEFTAPDGSGGVYPYAAAIRKITERPLRDVVSLSYSLAAVRNLIDDEPAGTLAARTRLLGDVLTAFGQDLPVPTASAPAAPRRLAISSHPNPFNPRATVVYELPAAGHVVVDVVDLRGRRIRTLLDAVKPAGTGHVIWDGTDDHGRACASGLYFHVLRSGGETRLGKMMLVR